jgi:hypothetical protein
MKGRGYEMRLVVVVGASVVAWLASALPAQAQQVPLPADGNVAVCAEGVCAPGSTVPTGRVPYDLMEMTVGQTLPALCAGQTETVYRASEDVWVSTCPPERADFSDPRYYGVERFTPVASANVGSERWTLTYSRRSGFEAPCATHHTSFVGLDHGSGESRPKTGVETRALDFHGGGPFCGP